MGATPIYALPYPETSDPVDGHAQIMALANRIEAIFQSGAAPVLPVGAILDWGYASGGIPAWALLCYGQAISRTTYSALAALASAAGYPNGSGDGSTTFNLPDFRGRSSAGKDDMGGTTAGRITAAVSGSAGTILGVAVGAEGVTLTTAQIPVHNHGTHTHGGSTGTDSPDHAHSGTTGTESADHSHSFTTGGRSAAHSHTQQQGRSIAGATNYGLPSSATGPNFAGNVLIHPNAGGQADNFATDTESADHSHSGGTGGRSAAHTHDVTTGGASARHSHSISADGAGNAGSGNIHPSMPPTVIVNKMIRAL